VKVTPYLDLNEEELYLDAERFLPIPDAVEYQIQMAAKKQEDGKYSGEKLKLENRRRVFWERVLVELHKRKMFTGITTSQANWIGTGTGLITGVDYKLSVSKNSVRAELCINTRNKEKNKEIFNKLKEKEIEIQKSFGEKNLEWMELPDDERCRISVDYEGYGLNDEENWNKVIDFFIDSLEKLEVAFKQPLKTLKVQKISPEEG